GTLTPGTVYRQPVITMDLTATALAAAGADRGGIEGIDLLPFLASDQSGAPHEVLYWRSRTTSNNYAARKADWKYVHSTEGAQHPGPEQTPGRDMLFNLAEDIGEKNDLASANPEKLAELRALYETWSGNVDSECRKLGIKPLFAKGTVQDEPK
ncbi:MAG TPA: hypothetical protein VMF30_04970, partial [Pirellulales bacterium]|nr:hypothetical protein [Pirellulales bacterium]